MGDIILLIGRKGAEIDAGFVKSEIDENTTVVSVHIPHYSSQSGMNKDEWIGLRKMVETYLRLMQSNAISLSGTRLENRYEKGSLVLGASVRKRTRADFLTSSMA